MILKKQVFKNDVLKLSTSDLNKLVNGEVLSVSGLTIEFTDESYVDTISALQDSLHKALIDNSRIMNDLIEANNANANLNETVKSLTSKLYEE